jgi:lysophospholipase L1-like esterase
MSRTLLARLALLVGTVIVMVAVLEVAIRQVFPVPPTWIEPQVTHLESPLLGWVLPPGLDAYTIDAPVHVNDLGYRDDPMPRAKPPDELRVLGLGDSFTFALGVRFEDLWVQQLERMLADRLGPGRPVQVVNAGVAGYNTRQELIFLETDGWRLQPDVVVVGFYWNDLVGNDEPLPDLATTPRYHPERLAWERGAREQGHLIPAPIRNRLRRSVLLYQLTTRVKQLRDALLAEPGEYSLVQRALLEGDERFLAPYWEATTRRLRELAASAAAHDVPVVLMAFPMENEIRFEFPAMRMADDLREAWGPTGMPFIDLGPAYREALEAGRNPFLPYDLHPNAEGMQIASVHLMRVFESEGYLARAGDGIASSR